MNKFLKISFAAIIIAMSAVTFTSCEKDFDNPPMFEEPNIVPTTTIAALAAMHTPGAVETITGDLIIAGVVNADDKSGNYYKQISIQDSTGGITIRLDGNNLYTSYPVGRKIYMKLKGLTLNDYGGLTQIATGATGLAIPSALFDTYIVKGGLGYVVTPKVVTVAQLDDSYLSTLIQIKDAEFVAGDTAKTYALPSIGGADPQTVNLTVKPCTGDAIVLRTSGYSNFVAENVPNGNGTITAIYTKFKATSGTVTKQLVIRDSTDVQFTNPVRCGGVVTPPPVGTVLLSQNFESQTENGDIAIVGWNNYSEAGTKKWYAKTVGTNKYALVSAFGSNAASVKTWLITSGVNLGSYATKTLTFKTVQGFTGVANALASTLKVMVSTNYTGTGNPTAATWIDLTSQAALSPGQASGYPFDATPSGNINLNSYTGTLYVAFVYEGADPTGTASDKTSTWELDDITVTGN